MGAGVGCQVEASPEGTALGIVGPKNHPSHACLHQGPGTHRTGLQRHDQAAVVEAPVPPQPCGLLEGHQLGVPQGALLPLSAIHPPAHGPSLFIQNDRGDRDLADLPHLRGAAQQASHPDFVFLNCVQTRRPPAGFLNHASTADPTTRDNGR